MKYLFIIFQLRVYEFITCILMTCVHDIWRLVPVLLMGRWKCRPLRCFTHEDGKYIRVSSCWILETGRMTTHLPSERWPRKCRCASMKVSSNCSWEQHPCDGVKLGICQASHGSSAALVELGAGLWLLPRLTDLKLPCVFARYTEECKHILGPAISRVCKGGNSWVKTMSSVPHSTVWKYCFGFLFIP